MKVILVLILIATAAMLMTACKANIKNTESYRSVDVATAKDIIATEDNVVILDVRTPSETANGIVEGAMKIDVLNSSFVDEIAKLDKEKTYVVYCKSGGRSVRAAKKMLKAGFTNVVNVEGGYTAWK